MKDMIGKEQEMLIKCECVISDTLRFLIGDIIEESTETKYTVERNVPASFIDEIKNNLQILDIISVKLEQISSILKGERK